MQYQLHWQVGVKVGLESAHIEHQQKRGAG